MNIFCAKVDLKFITLGNTDMYQLYNSPVGIAFPFAEKGAVISSDFSLLVQTATLTPVLFLRGH